MNKTTVQHHESNIMSLVKDILITMTETEVAEFIFALENVKEEIQFQSSLICGHNEAVVDALVFNARIHRDHHGTLSNTVI